MQPFKIVLAAAVIIFASNVLTGCSPQGVSRTGIDRIEEAQEFRKTLHLSLREVSGRDDISVRVVLVNPENRPITSVQSWLSYNSRVVQGLNIRTEESPFDIVAPYDNTFDDEAGLVMIGRSSDAPIDAEEIVVAEITFERVGEGTVMFEAYDYTNDLSGHTSANMVVDETPYNLLLKPESPLLIIQ